MPFIEYKSNEQSTSIAEALNPLLVTHYQAVRNEILARMEMRQTVLTVYLGFLGAVFGLIMAENTYSNASIALPFVAFGVFWIIRDHELAIAYLGRWIKEDYLGHLKEIGLDDRLPRWQDSPLRQAYGTKILYSRYYTYLSVFAGSGFAGFIITATDSNVQLGWIVAGGIFTALTALIIILTLSRRHKVSEF